MQRCFLFFLSRSSNAGTDSPHTYKPVKAAYHLTLNAINRGAVVGTDAADNSQTTRFTVGSADGGHLVDLFETTTDISALRKDEIPISFIGAAAYSFLCPHQC